MSVELEALAVIHAEQGCLILNSLVPHEVGEVIYEGSMTVRTPDGGIAKKQARQPVTVVGVATREEFIRQNRRLDEMLGTSTAEWEPKFVHFYKVVATD